MKCCLVNVICPWYCMDIGGCARVLARVSALQEQSGGWSFLQSPPGDWSSHLQITVWPFYQTAAASVVVSPVVMFIQCFGKERSGFAYRLEAVLEKNLFPPAFLLDWIAVFWLSLNHCNCKEWKMDMNYVWTKFSVSVCSLCMYQPPGYHLVS